LHLKYSRMCAPPSNDRSKKYRSMIPVLVKESTKGLTDFVRNPSHGSL
jgi:hypothetical protein